MFNITKTFKKFPLNIKSYFNLGMKNLLLTNQSMKFISGNRQSKVNREKRENDKADKFWESVDKMEKNLLDLADEIENKYKETAIYVGRHLGLNSDGSKIDPKVQSNIVELYYVPLTVNDSSLIQIFNKQTQEMIAKGGRLVLYNELKNYNKSQPIEKQVNFKPPFDPLSAEEIKEIQQDFYELYENEAIFNFILQNGKSLYTELKRIKEMKIEEYENYLSKIKYIDHYGEAMKSLPPFNTKIAADFKKFEDVGYVKLFLSGIKFDENKLVDNLKEIYFNFYKKVEETLKILNSSENDNKKLTSTPLDEIKNSIEPCLFERIKAYVDYLFYNKLNFEFANSNTLPADKEEYYIFEKLFFKGVHVNRYLNAEPQDYILIDTYEDMGIRYYFHKYLIGDANTIRNDKNPLTPYAEFNSEEYPSKFTYKIKERNRKIVLRVYLFLKHPYQLKISKESNNSDNLIEYPANYTYNHLAVFENELQSPNLTYLIDNNFERWLLKHKLNHNNWKLVDIDNFMKGNPFFLKKSSFEETFEDMMNDQNLAVDLLAKKFPEIVNPDNFVLNLSFKENKKSSGAKKERKKKAEKEETPKTETKEDDNLLSLEFNYKITKIARPINDLDYRVDSEEYKKIEEEKQRLINEEFKKIQPEYEKEVNKINELRYAFNNEKLDSHEKIERLVKMYSLDKKESVKRQIKEPTPNLDDPKDIGKIEHKSELDKLVNGLIAKKLKTFIEKKNDII